MKIKGKRQDQRGMNSVSVSRFLKFRVLISAKRSEKACRCTVMMHMFESNSKFVNEL